ncbi:MAG: hypothetical protein OEY11_13405, partial [Gammaproteobacteria bacterium]|nr:hypothetical protein [Gammaproteobacteria bacterium]
AFLAGDKLHAEYQHEINEKYQKCVFFPGIRTSVIAHVFPQPIIFKKKYQKKVIVKNETYSLAVPLS